MIFLMLSQCKKYSIHDPSLYIIILRHNCRIYIHVYLYKCRFFLNFTLSLKIMTLPWIFNFWNVDTPKPENAEKN